MLSLIVRFSWPFGALAVAFVLALLLVLDETDPMVLVLGLPCAVAFPVNTCLQVRWLLKRSLPERTRTRGFVLALRVTGWVVCSVVTFAVTVGVVGLWLVGVMDSRGGWF